MQPINEMKIEFLSKSNNESFARVVAAAFVSQLDPTMEELADVKTAVSEAVTNAIIHGYEDTIGYVKMECRLYEDSVEIIVEDKGKGIDNIELARQPLYTSKPELERSGMGFTVMETFMDSVEVKSEPGVGTLVKMCKSFKSLKGKQN
ncbi:anti-sigma F factor [Clostridium thermosuccinogenes]|uniref:Anti-sigma F factor n=1 Tax=Clostridium thermosuccinogenes TaxID=84032 RepID=A0A2K2FKL2_9CLOT|nr:anti-sigma F factor [Pseudoclostridium thermosuccinogenes]AUS97668.1 anti-sigma F factor [Pseudoclostridium thermosuccinogenes]PNT97382.1 anti-sigma F factor [Pseudoclostridium thermosuccinogenes]PNT99318.1 anti-sigma F factor [Pseudoclostridium thermosuccinogenes]